MQSWQWQSKLCHSPHCTSVIYHRTAALEKQSELKQLDLSHLGVEFIHCKMSCSALAWFKSTSAEWNGAEMCVWKTFEVHKSKLGKGRNITNIFPLCYNGHAQDIMISVIFSRQTIHLQYSLIYMKYGLTCKAITHLSKYFDALLFFGVTKCFLAVTKNNLILLTACHGRLYAVKQVHHGWIFILPALTYIVDVFFMSLHPTHLHCKENSEGVDTIASSDAKVTLNEKSHK